MKRLSKTAAVVVIALVCPIEKLLALGLLWRAASGPGRVKTSIFQVFLHFSTTLK